MLCNVENMPISPLVDAANRPPKEQSKVRSTGLRHGVAMLPKLVLWFHCESKRGLVMSVGTVAALESNSGWPVDVNVPLRGTVLVVPLGAAAARVEGRATTAANKPTKMAAMAT